MYAGIRLGAWEVVLVQGEARRAMCMWVWVEHILEAHLAGLVTIINRVL